jgi:hypothetical protein
VLVSSSAMSSSFRLVTPWVIGGFDAFLGTALLGAVGFIVGKVVAGQLDLTTYLGGGGRNAR